MQPCPGLAPSQGALGRIWAGARGVLSCRLRTVCQQPPSHSAFPVQVLELCRRLSVLAGLENCGI